MPLLGSDVASLEVRGVFAEVAFNFLLQRIHQPRNRYQHRNPLALDGGDDLGRIQRIFKNDSCAQQWRKKNSQKLPEHMTQRQQVEEAQGMHQPLILPILLDLPSQGNHVPGDIRMAEHDTLRFRGRPRSKDNFQRIRRLDRTRKKKRIGMANDGSG
jgi:hypothetical protein